MSSAPRATRPTRAVRLRRRVARLVVAAAVIVLFVTQMRLGFVDVNEHPGLVRTAWITLAVFAVAFPFVGFRDAGRRDGDEPREAEPPGE